MRRSMAAVLSLGIFFTSALSLAAAMPGKAEKAAPSTGTAAAVRVTRMKAAGVVTEISDTTLKIERKFRDKVETMEFVLEKPLTKIKVTDKVRVSYVNKEDRNIATKVELDIPQKVIKKSTTIPETKTVPAIIPPATKN